MAHRYSRRLAKELQELQQQTPQGMQILRADRLDLWLLRVYGAPGTLYQGEVFTLQFTFDENYPMEAPEVIFIGEPPIHPHIYSNGHICLSILYDNWSPALTASSVCLSILSMLSSCPKKERPQGNDDYVRTHFNVSPKKVKWYVLKTVL